MSCVGLYKRSQLLFFYFSPTHLTLSASSKKPATDPALTPPVTMIHEPRIPFAFVAARCPTARLLVLMIRCLFDPYGPLRYEYRLNTRPGNQPEGY